LRSNQATGVGEAVATKRTWLYIVAADSLPEVPFELGQRTGRVELMGTREHEDRSFSEALGVKMSLGTTLY